MLDEPTLRRLYQILCSGIQYYLYIMPPLGLCHFLALWRGGIMVTEVIWACGYMPAE